MRTAFLVLVLLSLSACAKITECEKKANGETVCTQKES